MGKLVVRSFPSVLKSPLNNHDRVEPSTDICRPLPIAPLFDARNFFYSSYVYVRLTRRTSTTHTHYCSLWLYLAGGDGEVAGEVKGGEGEEKDSQEEARDDDVEAAEEEEDMKTEQKGRIFPHADIRSKKIRFSHMCFPSIYGLVHEERRLLKQLLSRKKNGKIQSHLLLLRPFVYENSYASSLPPPPKPQSPARPLFLLLPFPFLTSGTHTQVPLFHPPSLQAPSSVLPLHSASPSFPHTSATDAGGVELEWSGGVGRLPTCLHASPFPPPPPPPLPVYDTPFSGFAFFPLLTLALERKKTVS